jgi:hypothetical protein
MKKRVLIISNYYPPEMGAASNRIKNLAEGLVIANMEVTVICPLPNYPKGIVFPKYKGKFKADEKSNGVFIKRYWLYPSKSKNSFIRLFSMLSFAFTIWSTVFNFLIKKPNLCIVNSPPLFVGLSGLLLTKFIRCKSILNVSDLWPLSALELGIFKKGKLYSLLKKIELLNYKLATNIIGQSNEINEHIFNLVNKEPLLYRNAPVFKQYEAKIKERGSLTIHKFGFLIKKLKTVLQIVKANDNILNNLIKLFLDLEGYNQYLFIKTPLLFSSALNLPLYFGNTIPFG